MRRKAIIAALLLGSAFSLSGCDKIKQAVSGKSEIKVVETEFPERVFWGDTHLHTANSVDAFGFGNRLGPEEALRFARGEEVTSSTGQKAKLARPLDFLVIADHAEGLGATKALYDAPAPADH
jgi:lactam utilization protein B